MNEAPSLFQEFLETEEGLQAMKSIMIKVLVEAIQPGMTTHVQSAE